MQLFCMFDVFSLSELSWLGHVSYFRDVSAQKRITGTIIRSRKTEFVMKLPSKTPSGNKLLLPFCHA